MPEGSPLISFERGSLPTDQPSNRLHKITDFVSDYHNRRERARFVSAYYVEQVAGHLTYIRRKAIQIRPLPDQLKSLVAALLTKLRPTTTAVYYQQYLETNDRVTKRQGKDQEKRSETLKRKVVED